MSFQPTPPNRAARRAVERQKLDDSLVLIANGVVNPITKERTIQVQRAGGYFKARFAGSAIFCFGVDPQQATKRVKYFDN
jgi:hypothetical protein